MPKYRWNEVEFFSGGRYHAPHTVLCEVNLLPGENALKSDENIQSIEFMVSRLLAESSHLQSVDLKNFSNLTYLEHGVFAECFNLEKVELSQSLRSIGEAACSKCYRLETVDFKASPYLKIIPERMFVDCFNLKTVNLKGCNALTTIGESAFSNCSELGELDLSLHPALTVIAKCAFQFAKLDKFTLAGCNSLKEIHHSAFQSCIRLGDLDLSSHPALEFIGSYAFANADLGGLILKGCNSLKQIGCAAFFRSKLTSVDLSHCLALTSIGAGAFAECSALTVANLSGCAALTFIDQGVFDYTNLNNINLSGCTSLAVIRPSTFAYCAAQTLDLSGCTRLAVIEAETFYRCSLKTLDLSGCTSLSIIKEYAFYGCFLETLDLSGCTSLSVIKEYAFYGCQNLSFIVVANEKEVERFCNFLVGNKLLQAKVISRENFLNLNSSERVKILTQPTDSLVVNATHDFAFTGSCRPFPYWIGAATGPESWAVSKVVSEVGFGAGAGNRALGAVEAFSASSALVNDGGVGGVGVWPKFSPQSMDWGSRADFIDPAAVSDLSADWSAKGVDRTFSGEVGAGIGEPLESVFSKLMDSVCRQLNLTSYWREPYGDDCGREEELDWGLAEICRSIKCNGNFDSLLSQVGFVVSFAFASDIHKVLGDFVRTIPREGDFYSCNINDFNMIMVKRMVYVVVKAIFQITPQCIKDSQSMVELMIQEKQNCLSMTQKKLLDKLGGVKKTLQKVLPFLFFNIEPYKKLSDCLSLHHPILFNQTKFMKTPDSDDPFWGQKSGRDVSPAVLTSALLSHFNSVSAPALPRQSIAPATSSSHLIRLGSIAPALETGAGAEAQNGDDWRGHGSAVAGAEAGKGFVGAPEGWSGSLLSRKDKDDEAISQGILQQRIAKNLREVVVLNRMLDNPCNSVQDFDDFSAFFQEEEEKERDWAQFADLLWEQATIIFRRQKEKSLWTPKKFKTYEELLEEQAETRKIFGWGLIELIKMLPSRTTQQEVWSIMANMVLLFVSFTVLESMGNDCNPNRDRDRYKDELRRLSYLVIWAFAASGSVSLEFLKVVRSQWQSSGNLLISNLTEDEIEDLRTLGDDYKTKNEVQWAATNMCSLLQCVDMLEGSEILRAAEKSKKPTGDEGPPALGGCLDWLGETGPDPYPNDFSFLSVIW